MNTIVDPIRAGLSRHWKVQGGLHGALPEAITCDVAIVGSGAGAGITAELLTAAGLSVVIVEEGPLRSSSYFKQLKGEAYPTPYQEGASRRTVDEAMAPWFQQAEQRLAIVPWLALPNENNQLLRTGAGRLGIPAAAIMRNVTACIDGDRAQGLVCVVVAGAPFPRGGRYRRPHRLQARGAAARARLAL